MLMKVLGVGLVLLVAPILGSYTPAPLMIANFVVENSETVSLAPCLKWRPDILDLVMTGVRDSTGKKVVVSDDYPWQEFTLVAVSKNGSCEVLVADERLADRLIVSVAGSEPRDPIGLPNDQSGTYILFELKSDKKSERLFAGLVLPLPKLEQELRGVPQLHS